MTDDPRQTVICFGEILWDSLPRGLFPGGAPMNVAYHLQQLGAQPLPVTAVGRDQLGDELLRRLTAWNVDVAGVSIHPTKPTGIARVTIKNGRHEFEIVADAAWDAITIPAPVLERAARSAAVVFGSLAQRSEQNRRQLAGLLDGCSKALKVFDVNLRPPYDAVDRVWVLAKQADLIKLNDHELAQLLEERIVFADLEGAVRRLAERVGVSQACLTAGDRGAGLLLDDHWYWEPARPALVQDSVGAGDSFLAALLSGLLKGKESPSEILRRACRLAEFVVTQDGATPPYQLDDHGNPQSVL